MPKTKHRRKGKTRDRWTPSPAQLQEKARLRAIRNALAEWDIDKIISLKATINECRKAVQPMERYKDFDEAVASEEPISFTMKGKRYEIAGDPEAGVILKLMREGRLDDPNVGGEVLSMLLGQENLDQMLQDGMGLKQMVDLSEWVMEQMGFDLEDATTKNGDGTGDDNPNQ